MSSSKKLRDLINSHQLILFAGSGVSATLNLPDWRQLVNRIASELDYSPEIFKVLTSDKPLVMAEYYKIIKGSIGPLRSKLDVEWHNQCEDKILKSEIHKTIVELDFPLIYTTNYDRYLEIAFNLFKDKNSYTKILGPEDLTQIRPNKNQIIKFHGDFERDDSIVLSESDYFRRLSFEDPLDIKFRSDSLAKSILFIGYSLSDVNIRFIMYKLSKIWKESKNPPKSYLFTKSSNPIQEKVLAEWNVEVITNDVKDRSESLLAFLQSLK